MTSRLVLAPGLRVLRSGPEHVQIGLGGRHRLRLARSAALLRVLDALDRGETAPGDPAARRALALLAPALVDADALAPVGIGAADVGALALRAPGTFAATVRRRRMLRVAVTGRLGESPADALPDPARLLGSAGFTVTDDPAAAAAVLVLSRGEPDRAVLDPLVRDGIGHLLVRAVEEEVVVGPLVEPGRGACLRCLDAHHSVDEPMHPVLVATHHRAARHDAVSEPLDSALACLAIGWAVRDLTAHLDGEAASSWSATIGIGPDLGSLRVVTWLPHPGCGCGWTAAEDPSDTMRA